MANVPEYFGSDVFNESVMKERLCGLLRQACPACSGASRRNAAGNCALSLRALCARTLGWTGDYMSGTYRTDTYYLDCTRKTGICYLDCTRRAG